MEVARTLVVRILVLSKELPLDSESSLIVPSIAAATEEETTAQGSQQGEK